jgi:gliding motility-associated-like protein
MTILFKNWRLILILALSSTTFFAQGQVMINEYSTSNINGLVDQFGNQEDWVELYNAGGTSVDISGYYLSDNDNNPIKWEIPAGTVVPAGGYQLFICSKRDVIQAGEIHTSFNIKQTKPEELLFADGLGTVIDIMDLDTMRTMLDQSRGRATDGAPVWALFPFPTPGAANTGPLAPYSATPIFDQLGGYYGAAVNLSITTTDPTATVYYTIDGSEPTVGSTVVANPINVPATAVVRARGFSTNPAIPSSFVETNTYFVNTTHTVPIMSIAGDEVDDLLNGNQIVPLGSIEYFDENGVLMDKGYGEFNEHGNDSWAYDQRGFDYITRDQYGYSHSINAKLFETKTRDQFQRIIVKAAANDNINFEDGAHIRDSYVHHLSQLAELKIDERSWAPVILYVNGEYWGVYDTREKVDDHDFMKYYYNQGKYDIDFIKTWGGTWADYGDMDHWTTFYAFASTNDLTVQANFDYVDSAYSWKSLIDYVLLNGYTVCADWLNWNTQWWHGHNPNGTKKKFRYGLWDMDATFGHYVNYTGIPNQGADADPCDPEVLTGGSDPEGHIIILNKLLENEVVKQYYIARYADLSNTSFHCTNMLFVLDSMISVIQPEMQQQITRWGNGATYAGWQDNVTTLRTFITDRCAAITQGMIDCYQLSGPHTLTVDVDPPLAGTVKINSVTPASYIWSGTYYGGMQTLLKANAASGYVFDYWEMVNHTLPTPDTVRVTFELDTFENVIAHFRLEGEEPTSLIPPEEFLMQIPSAFSPNDDGLNDMLEIFYTDVDKFDLVIYNRWGERMFATEDPSIFWDGKFDGKLLNSGVYTYKLMVKFIDESVIQRGGNITLLR